MDAHDVDQQEGGVSADRLASRQHAEQLADDEALLRGLREKDFNTKTRDVKQSAWRDKHDCLSVWREADHATPAARRVLRDKELKESIAFAAVKVVACMRQSVFCGRMDAAALKDSPYDEPPPEMEPYQCDGRYWELRVEYDNHPHGHCNIVIVPSSGEECEPPRAVRTRAAAQLRAACRFHSRVDDSLYTRDPPATA